MNLYVNELLIKFENNNKKPLLAPVQNLLMCFVKKHSIALMALLTNRLNFYSRM